MTGNFQLSPGHPLPLGPTLLEHGVNFALFARHATAVWLLLFEQGGKKQLGEIKLDPEINRTGDIWHIQLSELDHCIEYAYRLDGPFSPDTEGHWFDEGNVLLDPYAKAISGIEHWGKQSSVPPVGDNNLPYRCLIVDDAFDWEGDRPLNRPLKDSIIYELHVRGFSRHRSSAVVHPGTYRGLIEKIPYLRELGITAIELMPVTEFNECENTNRDPQTGRPLKNYWGYSPIAFFAPKASYAADGFCGRQVIEFKKLVKAMHKAGIEVILDIVFNHTAEGNGKGPILSFRGLDNTIYYLLDRQSWEYQNFSGCGNTFNCNHPLVRNFIMDCLHYWVMEMHVDGFRFDLASILGRDQNGEVLSNPPMVEMIAEDPLLADTKIIAEAWDASGLYQVGSFSHNVRWAEWNGRFRDDVRMFLCGQNGMVASLATRIAGSSDLYNKGKRRPYNSINFLTSHDGFTLYDLMSYNQKHNERNGEDNRDGDNHNFSWNSGHEGETRKASVQELRLRRMKTAAVILFLSQGTPMFPAGDEFCRTQKGNNNAYCQDNEISWIDWRLVDKHSDMLRFFQNLIKLRKRHHVFRRNDFFSGEDEHGKKEIIWQSILPGKPDWSESNRCLAFYLNGRALRKSIDDDFFVMLNGNLSPTIFELPRPQYASGWRLLIDTAAGSPADFTSEEEAKVLKGKTVTVAPMGAVVLLSKRKGN